MANDLLYNSTLLLLLLLGAGLFISLLSRRYRRNPKRLPLPPGPKGYPIIGNVFNMPTEKPWLTYDKWLKMYGDVVYFTVLGQPFLALGSMEAVNDLLERRSSNYSDRMRSPMMNELMGWDFNFAMQPYGALWRRHHRAFHEYFHTNVVGNYESRQSWEARALLRRLLISPDNFMEHIRHFFASTIMSIVYDIPISGPHDPYVQRVEVALEGFSAAGNPGSFLVDLIPALKYVPSWFPGAGFKRKAARWKEVNQQVLDLPFQDVLERMAKGAATPSVALSMIERLPDADDPRRAGEEKMAKGVTSVAFTGGADTTISAVQSFFLAMAMYPQAQKMAQEEIDRVVGPHRLPGFEDRESLPFIQAVVKEVMRWNMVAPLGGMPHMVTEDDEYREWHIPRGTVIVVNSWSLLHDPDIFSDPLDFKPERFIRTGEFDKETIRDPDSLAFGFGRRICPGRHLAKNSLYAVVSCVLAVFDIKPPLDENGREVKLTGEMTSGTISYPKPFVARITPRSPAAEALIREMSSEE